MPDEVLPPGQHPLDSRKPDVDQLAFALTRVRVMLRWIDEHRRSFEKERDSHSQDAESELRNLADATEQAVLHLQRLRELLLAGHAIDPTKRLPQDFFNEAWDRWVAIFRRERGIDPNEPGTM